MTDTSQLPPHTITIRDHPEPHIMQWSDLELAAIMKYAESYALQARAQVQGEPFGYIHHFVAHDEHGALIDTTWEADGCADAMPHPTRPAAWEWSHSTPFYTAPQPAPRPAAVPMTDDSARYDLLRTRFNNQKSSACRRIVEDFGLDGDPLDGLDSLVDKARHDITAQAKKEGA